MPTSNRKTAHDAVRAGNINQVINGTSEQIHLYRDTVNVLSTDIIERAAVGTVGITTAGVATFTNDQTTTFILAVGDYLVIAGVKYTVTAVNSATQLVVSPAPAVAIAGGTAYTPYQARSFTDIPCLPMAGLRLLPEFFRCRFGGTGALSATFKFQRVNTITGVATDLTTAVATTAAALWQGVPATTAAAEQILSADENLRLLWTTGGTTFNTGRTILVELAFARPSGPHLQ